ncbi:MAG TPA: acetyl/propionyl/methylcrotonyl-CoA carboxylase subunit alpha [Burkholderiales bacterium]|nr:acetyl/propionyl/methylcrotonyl-CoA carboxylase subunit alpha [Burkholderiales bacterium]
MFKKILIANRGEIACRVIKTARKMGIKTVAVYSEADKDARHVEMADEAVCIGPPPSKDSYLVMGRIVQACLDTGAEAVHPGYGFLSENAAFCEALERAGVVFIGPKVHSIQAMGDKIASKRLALEAKVNTIPGYNDVIRDADHAAELARGIGYPVMIKASAGGGGKGLRVAWDEAQCREGFQSCRNEARASFGDDRVFIEKFVEQPRHIEIQVLGDAHGNIVYLWERECSIQRRHQKVIEEAPSPFLDEKTRRAMGEQAVRLARAVNYQSAGTVEFVVGKNRDFYFLEMNTRLQVEHPVTEMITGLDLVEQMIRVAAGERLAFRQEDVRLNGWAMEARVCAEDPFRNFLPSIGRLVKYRPPEQVEGAVRTDTGVYEGGEISMYYDPLIAKQITHGATREQAIARMREALNAFVIRGVSHNISFVAALMQHHRFLSGDFHTGFIGEYFPKGFHPASAPHADPALLIAVAAFARRRYIDRAVKISNRLPGHERRVGQNWVVMMNAEKHPVTVTPTGHGYTIAYNGEEYDVRSNWRLGEVLFHGTCNGEKICLQIERQGLRFRITHWGTQADVMVMTAQAADLLSRMPEKPKPDFSKYLLSPMPGLLTDVAVKAGQEIKAGEKLAVIEAMKMENILKAEQDGVVANVLAKPGESLAVDQPILEFK